MAPMKRYSAMMTSYTLKVHAHSLTQFEDKVAIGCLSVLQIAALCAA